MGEAPPSMVPLQPTAVVFRHPRRRALTTRPSDRYSQLRGRMYHSPGTMDEGINRPDWAVLLLLRLVGVSPGPTIRKAARDDRSNEALPCHAPRGDHRPT
jgi:hypothetical protein